MADHVSPEPADPLESQPHAPRLRSSVSTPEPESNAGPGHGAYGQRYGYADYGGYGSQSEAHDDLMHYIRTLYRRRWTALAALVVVVILVAVYSFTATPIFEARTQLLIQPENPNVVSFKEVLEQEKGTNEYYQTQYTILKSRALARRTIEALKLWDSPEFGGGPAQAKRFSIKGLVGWVGSLFSSGSEPSSIPAVGETDAQSRVIDAYLGQLTVSPIRNSRLVDIRFASPNPRTAAMVANTIAKGYIEQNLEYKFLSTREASDWLSGQMAEQRKRLEDSEQALQRYREQGNAVSLEDRQNIVVQRLTDLSTAYTQARTTRIEKEALYNQLANLQSSRGALDSFPAVLANTFIQGLKTQLSDLQRQQAQMGEKLGENHPDMVKLASAIANTQARIDGEIGKVVQSVRSEFLSAQAQERSLSAELETQKSDALALNRTGIEYSVLKRDADSNKQIYESLMQRAKETGISGELKTSNVRVVDEAQQPRSPVRPRKGVNLLLSLFGGVMAGLGLVFLLEFVDSRIKDPDEIQNRLGIPFLGIVPGLDLKEMEVEPLLDSGTPAHFSEAYRGIRTNLVFSSEEAGSRAIVVTSTQPSEGKTIVAANLAISLAQTGQRVLLIDCDMRKPRQQQVFGAKDLVGLSGVLAGTGKISDAVQRTGRKSLWLLPAGSLPPNPAELLGTERFKQLLKTLRQEFDWTIIDSPPVMAVTDAAVIAHLATGVVFVVGCEQTSRNLALRAIRQLVAAKATFLGGILNRVDLQRNPYYYSHYYKREYTSYYTSGRTKN
jgi:succinoglycan biosynthesis transport protein ExoP